MSDRPASLGAREAAAAIAAGDLSAVELVRDCLRRIAEREETVRAWAFLDERLALSQAEAADRRRRDGSGGPLNGVPIGIKDNFDTADMPTENGTVLHAGRQPERDAAAVALLRAAGAVIMGKTVTTELASYFPGKTRNPRDPARTPGGSSSGSAAAVADFMVPLATGSQTNASIVRPAAFCGIVGYKPTRGLIPRDGVLTSSEALDTIGGFARSVADAALMMEQLMVHDWRDRHAQPRARPRLVEVCAEEPPTPPRIAFVRNTAWPDADEGTRTAFTALAARLKLDEVPLPAIFDEAIALHTTVNDADLARNYAREYERGADKLSPRLRGLIENGRKVTAIAYIGAREKARALNRALADIFADHDAILTPASLGTAPVGHETTGNPVFCSLWTLCGVPVVCLPLLKGADGMPLGVQLVGARNDDARLLRTARWLTGQVA